MTKHTKKELLDGYVNGAPLWGPEGRLFSFSVTTNQGLCSNVRKMLSNPEQFTLTDPRRVSNKSIPKVGEPLTLSQLHDVEFMRGVARLEVESIHAEKPANWVNFSAWSNQAVASLEWAIETGLAVTVAEVCGDE